MDSQTNKKNLEHDQIISLVWNNLIQDASGIIQNEPYLKLYYYNKITKHKNFKDAIINLLTNIIYSNSNTYIRYDYLIDVIEEIFKSNNNLEYIICLDIVEFKKRDPACTSFVDVFLNYKGFKALQLYRISNKLWTNGKKQLALIIQSKCSEMFSIDIHPGAIIGKGVVFDHGSGIVIGETAVVGDYCLLYHNVTLGGTGKISTDRHPKIGNNVIIGCGSTLLGNISIGSNCKIGAGSIVTKSVESDNTIIQYK